MAFKYVKPERVSLKSHPELTEFWVQGIIADDPTILGLGDLVLRDKERPQPRTGRLDLLLQEVDSDRRYEIEIQLGKTDESHIIRTIEYWDIERKRYPQYEHTAVIVAEDITSRFLNVIGLFNGFIPLVAIQMQAYAKGDEVSLIFTKVLDQMRLGMGDEDIDQIEVVDRSYWEKRASKSTLEVADQFLSRLVALDAKIAPKYNKFYIGLTREGRPDNFISFRPKKEWLWIGIRLEKSDEIDSKLEKQSVDEVDYDAKWGKYWIRVTKQDYLKHLETIQELFRLAYQNAVG
jgi:predicted transport protein